ncbi:hypothetical protein [Rodentibacter heidelbergensis]|uniref:hypothetical protein n=1 Tax=Rodentibacter heidelbergensis TaxID=1908258 RepID=UPI001ABF72E3|nr:hypothetical protein [Rodentibacter heidelbergensis]
MDLATLQADLDEWFCTITITELIKEKCAVEERQAVVNFLDLLSASYQKQQGK